MIKLYNDFLIAKETGELPQDCVDNIIKMVYNTTERYIKKREGLTLSEDDKNEMIQNALLRIFETKPWDKIKYEKVKGDKEKGTFSYVTTIILCEFANYMGKLAKKRINERQGVS